MATKILDPNIEVPPIVVKIDEYAVGGLDDFMKGLGQYIPLLKFGDRNITWNKVETLEMEVSINSLPVIRLKVLDEDRAIRRFLKNDIDVGVCRIGYNNFRMQFNILYTEVYNDYGDYLMMEGILWDEKMFNSDIQESFRDKTFIDILSHICKETDLGLYVYENDYITKSNDIIVRSNETFYEFLNRLIGKHTNNVWCIDPNYFLHVGDFEEMMKQDVSEYTLDFRTGEKMDKPQPMIFYQNIGFGKEEYKKGETVDEDVNRYKFAVKNYIPDTSLGVNFLNSKLLYKEYNEKKEITKTQKEFGMGVDSCNTYSGFTNHKIGFIDNIRSKDFSRQLTKVYTDYIIPELNIFSLVELELYRNMSAFNQLDEVDYDETKTTLDVEHSGKRLVIGYVMRYNKKKDYEYNPDENSLFEQEILCI